MKPLLKLLVPHTCTHTHTHAHTHTHTHTHAHTHTFLLNGLCDTGGGDRDDPVVVTEDLHEGGGQLSVVVLAHVC